MLWRRSLPAGLPALHQIPLPSRSHLPGIDVPRWPHSAFDRIRHSPTYSRCIPGMLFGASSDIPCHVVSAVDVTPRTRKAKSSGLLHQWSASS